MDKSQLMDLIDQINLTTRTVKTLLNTADDIIATGGYIEAQDLIELSLKVLDDFSKTISAEYETKILNM